MDGAENLIIQEFRTEQADGWDRFAETSPTGTFQHMRRFLSYHGNRFEDRSLMVTSGGETVAIFPAALDPSDPSRVVSHPGATFGGLVASEDMRPAAFISALQSIKDHYRGHGIKEILCKTIPMTHHRTPNQVDAYAMWVAGFTLARRDLWNFVFNAVPRAVSDGRRRAIQKAARGGVVAAFEDSDAAYAEFHAMLAENLRARYNVAPVHSLSEMLDLRGRIRNDVALAVARKDSVMVAGTWVFRFRPNLWHSQYIAGSEAGRRLNALDLLLNWVVEESKTAGVPFYSFGASTEQGGRVLNEGLFNYKRGFGGGGLVHDFYSAIL